MSHRVDASGSRRLGGFAGRVLAIAAATALCAAAIGLTVSMWGAPTEEPQPVVAPSGSAPSDSAPSSSLPAGTAPGAAAPSPSPATTPSSTANTAPPTTTVAPVAPTTATPTRTAPRVTSPARPRCTPHPQWVYRPSTGSYERITLPC